MLLGDATGNLGLADGLVPLAVCVGATLAALAASRYAPLRRWSFFCVAAAYAASAAQRVYAPAFAPHHVALLPHNAFTITAIVARPGGIVGGQATLLLEAQSLQRGGGTDDLHGLIRVSIRHVRKGWRRGQLVRGRLRLHTPRAFGTPGEFDMARHFARRNVYVTAFLDDDDDLDLVGELPPESYIDSGRRRIAQAFHEHLVDPDAAVLASLIIGDDQPLPPALRQAFNSAGIGHVLSISGLHMSLVALTSFRLLRWLLGRSERLLLFTSVPKTAALLSAVPLVVYAMLAGANAATLRSAVMAILVTGGILLDREARLSNSLAAAALVVVLLSPGATAEVSFQLSFAAVLGIAIAMQRFWLWWPSVEEAMFLRLRREWWVAWARPAAASLAVSVGAMSATLPLAAYHFNQISLIAPLANAVVVPVLGDAGVIVGLLAALAVVFVPALAAPLITVAGLIIRVGLRLTDLFAAVPFAAVRIVTPTWGELGLCYAAFGCVVLATGRNRRCLLWSIAVIATADVAVAYQRRAYPGALRVSFLSVGQGDCAVLELPDGEVMVVDGGGLGDGTFDVGERVVAPFLWQRRIARVDYVVATHPDWDHFGGLRFVAEQFRPREVWTSGAGSPRQGYLAFETAAAEAGALHLIVRRGDRWNLSGVDVRVVGPAHLDPAKDNDASVVLRLEWHGTSVLLTGDIEAPAEAEIVGASELDVRSTLLKIPHHGSKTSSTMAFLDTVAPPVAVLSAGFENRFGFPYPEIVGRYTARGIDLWRTDLHGTVTLLVDSDGQVHLDSVFARAPSVTSR